MKTILLSILLCALTFAQFLDDKFVILPTFEPKSQMSAEVKLFVENSSNKHSIVSKTTMKRDLLGRKTGVSMPYLVNHTQEERMKVVVSYVYVPEPFSGKMCGRYESGSSVEEKKFWLNGKEMKISI